MARRFRSPRIGHVLVLTLAMCLPALLGQGCPQLGPANIVPVGGADGTAGSSTGQSTPGSTNGNTAPVLTFTAPATDVAAEIGDIVTISWLDQDPDSNASITLLVDPDREYGNGNEIIILSLILEDDDITGDSFDLDTSSLTAASYRVIARITDGINPQQLVTAPGRILLYGAGLLPGNVSPTITVTAPTMNLGVSQGDTVDIEFCGRDIDDDGAGDMASPPDIVLLLDMDDDPTNDLDLSGSDAEDYLQSICFAGFFPVEIDGAYVLACFKDNDCGEAKTIPLLNEDGDPVLDEDGNPVFTTTPVTPLQYQLLMDVGTIPPRENGEPYRVRASMWDHVNNPVHSYAPGSVSVTTLGSGMIDLGQVGRTVSGSRFMGYNTGDRIGSTGTDLGDVDGDDIEDFAIVGQYGRGFENSNTGMAAVVLGLAGGQKFGSEILLSSVSTTYRGSLLTMPDTPETQGITSVTRLGDVTEDGLPDILFGMPYIQTFYDDHDDDPQDRDQLCYPDLWPNPLSTGGGEHDRMTSWDFREGLYGSEENPFICSQDLDLTRETPLSGGFSVIVASQNNLTSSVLRLDEMGQWDGARHREGARFRGAWHPFLPDDDTQTQYPFSLYPENRFGCTVSSMPPMLDTSLTVSPRFGTTLIVSAPDGMDDRGFVMVTPNNNFINFAGEENAASIPTYHKVSSCCRGVAYPSSAYIFGEAMGDHLGYAKPAGDYNLDGSRDLLMGAPGADRDGVRNAGICYIFFGRPDWPHEYESFETGGQFRWAIDLARLNPPRLEIRGTRNDDQFGTMQTIVGDVNQDGLVDVGFSSGYADGPGGTDSGFIGIVFGGRRLTGENYYTVDQVATAQLPGVRIYGIQPNGHAGMVINNAGDFNGDSTDDLLIVAPDEERTINGVTRRGVAYLIFGGTHMMGNPTFNLSQVGSTDLPGVVFVSPYTKGSADEAPIDWAGSAGDINSDGFDDIMLGVSEADYINPLEPSQRRPDAGEVYLIYGNNTGNNSM